MHAHYAETKAVGLWKVVQLNQLGLQLNVERLAGEDQLLTWHLIKEALAPYPENYNAALLREPSKAGARHSTHDQTLVARQ